LFFLSPLPAAKSESPSPSSPPPSAWQELELGLELGEFAAPVKSESGDSIIRVLRINPKYFQLRLFNASASPDKKSLSAREYSERNHLAAAINASMYQQDFLRSVSLMKTGDHINNSYFSKDKTILVFDPETDALPPVKLLDLDCDDFSFWRNQYRTLVQSIRMISCAGANVWYQSPKKWSTAAIGLDKHGKVLFLHVRSPYSTHDLVEILLGLPLEIDRMMYTEGGPEAQLYVQAKNKVYEFLGSYETSLGNFENPSKGWPIPNVIGVVRKNKNP
jgi:uncharacterized protein YigE (DUF2233 family)